MQTGVQLVFWFTAHVSPTVGGPPLNDPAPLRPWWDKFTPRLGPRAQLYAAAVVWLVGTGFLLVRGVLFVELPGPGVHISNWILPVALVAVVLGVLKARYVLIRYADKAVHRIGVRGHACFFGFFSVKSWLFVVVMMGGGIMLRHSPLIDPWWGRVTLSIVYIAVGTSLAIADRIFWRGAIRYDDGAAATVREPAGDAAEDLVAEAPAGRSG
jgi:hypothetical protein